MLHSIYFIFHFIGTSLNITHKKMSSQYQKFVETPFNKINNNTLYIINIQLTSVNTNNKN